MNAAVVMVVRASRNIPSIILTSNSNLVINFERSAQNIKYMNIRNAAAQIPNMSSTIDTDARVRSKVFIIATTVMQRPARPPEMENRLSNSSRCQLIVHHGLIHSN